MLAHGSALAHELTPTYPKLKPSYLDGISVTMMQMFNRREDVQFFEIDVYDEDWQPVTFATKDKIIQVRYLQRNNFEVFIRNSDVGRARYICTTSKLLTQNVESTGVSSRICSKIE
jgi:hypothetical protein